MGLTMRKAALLVLVGAGAAAMAAIGPVAAQSDDLPYWASIAVDEARMRKGPSPDVPVIWEYRRRDLPVRVVARYESWRKVEDPDGTSGWMAARLLSRTRTAIVIGGVAPMRETPDNGAAITFRAESGVVGRIADCDNGWCLFDVKGRRGWISTADIWGD
jgi:SH3-like domain-containing protein